MNIYNEILPLNCPPDEAIELEQNLFRIVVNEEISDIDFIPYAKSHKKNKRYKELCIAYAISFFETLDKAKSAFKEAKERNKILGRYIAEIKILKNLGKTIKDKNSEHYSLWLYKGFNYKNLECIRIIEINEV